MIILAADDDLDYQMILAVCFRRANFDAKIDFVMDGQQVFEYLDSCDHLPNLIVLDIQMPNLNGLETLERLKKNVKYQNIPAVMLTSSVNAKNEQKAKSLGASKFLKKPSSIADIQPLFKNLIHLFS